MPVLSHRRSVCEKAVAALATGDRSALATLYDCMGRSLFSVAYAVTGNWHDAEDVLQETQLDACRTAPSYRPGTSACAWLLAIARHKALDCVRRTGVRRAETLDDDRAAEEPGFAAVEALDLLRALDEEEREVVILRVYAALPYKELAPLLGITVAAAQKRYQRAMEKLRALRAKRPELILEVDGGVNRETAPICRENGADVAVAGTAVFRAENIPAEIALLRGE